MAGKKITITEIARLAGVSPTTVSHIFNGYNKKYRIADITTQQVLSIAEKYRDQEHVNRWIIKANQTQTIGVIVPDMSNYGFAIFLHELESILRQNQLQLLIACSHYDKEQEIQAVHNILERKVDGLIVITSLEHDDFYLQISQSVPVLLFDRYFTNSVLPFVASESIHSVCQLISHKAQQFDEFYFLGGDIKLSAINERLSGYKLGLKKAGLKLNPSWVVYDTYQQSLGFYLIEKIHRQLNRLPKAIFTSSGNILEGVLHYLYQHHINNQQIYLSSYDYNVYLNFLPYDIDIISPDYHLLAKNCFQQIQKLVNRLPLQQNSIYVKPSILHNGY